MKIPLANLLLKHRRHIAESGMNPLAERLSVKAFTLANSHPSLWKIGMNVGAKVAKLAIRDGKMPIQVGAIAEWTKARDLPDAEGESFRSWFKNR